MSINPNEDAAATVSPAPGRDDTTEAADWGWLREPKDLPGTCLTCHRTWRQCADMVIERNQDGVPGCCADCGHKPPKAAP